MVKGLELFRDWFVGFEDSYTLIGGAACDLWMGEQGLLFRATKDLDVVLAFDGQWSGFVGKLWEFVKAGCYEGYQAGEMPSNFYRFHKPKTDGFPAKLEICTKRLIDAPAHLKVIRLRGNEDVSALSAVLLDSVYYDLVRENGHTIQGVPTVTGACLIPLKAKAWLNLSHRKATGEHVDQNDIDKHRNDVFRLLLSVALDQDKIELVTTIRDDLRQFIGHLPADSPDWQNIKASLKSNNLILPLPSEAVRIFKEFHGLD